MDDHDEWRENRKLVLKSIEDLWRCLEEAERGLAAARIDIATLKVKAGLWGLLGGALAAALAVVARYLEAR